MSMNRRSRKIKPPHPDEQPQIIQYITDSPKNTILCEGNNLKERHRSTSEKPNAKKRVDSASEPLPIVKSTQSVPNEPDKEEVVSKMSTIEIEETKTNTSSPMLEEIMRMEARLTANITTNRDKDISEMESRLNANIKSTIDSSIKDALKTMQTSLCMAVQNNPLIKSHSTETKGLREENIRLNRKVQQLEAEQEKMKCQLNKIESKNLDRSLIIRGITEEYKESESSIIDKIHHILSEIMQGETKNEKLLSSRRIVIKSCKRLGRNIRSRIRPVSVELLHKEDANFILDNQFDLAKGVFVDREYPAEIERK